LRQLLKQLRSKPPAEKFYRAALPFCCFAPDRFSLNLNPEQKPLSPQNNAAAVVKLNVLKQKFTMGA
jgi:hypothetical protein